MEQSEMFTPVSAPPALRLSDMIAQQLEHMIVQGKLPPGENLPSERELAKLLDVSRPSLREALSKLRSRGLIEPSRKGGTVVTELTKPAFTEPLSRILDRNPSAIRDVIEMRFVLEAHAAFLAATHAMPADLRRMEASLTKLTQTQSRDVVVLAGFDLDFHRSIVKASHNIALLHTVHGLSRLTRTFVQWGFEIVLASETAHDYRTELDAQHTAIFRAIAGRDPEAARGAALAHIMTTEQIWGPPPKQRPKARTR